MTRYSLLITLASLAATAIVRAEVALDLSVVDTGSGKVLYRADNATSNRSDQADQMLVLLDAAAGNIGQLYTLTAVHAPPNGDKTSVEVPFEVNRVGTQYLRLNLPAPLGAQGEWWIQLTGKDPMPTAKSVLLRDRPKAVVPANGSGAASQSNNDDGDDAEATYGFYVIRPSKVVIVPPERVIHLPVVPGKRLHPAKLHPRLARRVIAPKAVAPPAARVNPPHHARPVHVPAAHYPRGPAPRGRH